MKTLKQQAVILRKTFGITISIARPPKQTEDTDGIFLIPKWNKIGKTYEEALEKVFSALKNNRPTFKNWREGQLGSEYLRELPGKDVPEIISVQLGKKWKGKSVNTVRKEKAPNEILLGAYEVVMILFLTPDLLNGPTYAGIDCAGDEASPVADGDFSVAPLFDWLDGGLRFRFSWASNAGDDFGTASGFLSQPLENRPLESFGSLTLEAHIEAVKDAGYQVSKII